MKHDPIKKFETLWDKASKNSPLRQPNAICLSTINRDGFPDGRFVDLKGIDNRCFVFCTSLKSKKAREISKNPKIALTIWWDHVGIQVRITGTAIVASDNEAVIHWQKRSRESQINSHCSDQSQEITDINELRDKIDYFKKNLNSESVIPKPADWGCFKLQPVKIEFLSFNENRLHIRELYEIKNDKWEKSLLQP